MLGVLSEKSGIKQVNVSLENKEAKVSYSDNDVTAEQISGFIEEMGFNSFIKEVNGMVYSTSINLNNNPPDSGNVSLELNGGGDVKKENQTAKCFLHITVNII